MNSDPQFWTAFKEAAQAAPRRVPAPAQWEALEQRLPAPQRRFPWLVWLSVNLMGLACLSAFAGFTRPPLSHFPLATSSSAYATAVTPPALLSQSTSPSSHHAQWSKATPPPKPYTINFSSPAQTSPAIPKSLPKTNHYQENQQLPAYATTHQITTPLSATKNLQPLTTSRPRPVPTVYAPQKTNTRYLSLSAHLTPFSRYDGGQGFQPSLGLNTALPLGFRALFRLSQVQTSWQWADFTAADIRNFRAEAPGLLLDASQHDKAIIFSVALSRPLLSAPSRWQINPLVGTAIALHQRSAIELLSFTEYGSSQPATFTPLSRRQNLKYWSSFVGLDLHYRLTQRLTLVVGSRYLLTSPQLPAAPQPSLQTGLSYRLR